LEPEKGHEFELDRKISARISAMRSWILNRGTRDSPLDPRVRRELNWLRDADGFVFVLDSQPARQPANREQLALLERDLRAEGRELDEIPVVFQANKRDLPNSTAMETLREEFRTGLCAHAESVASEGVGVLETVRLLLSMIEE
jgi:signal recognition particle receptor subunit beta